MILPSRASTSSLALACGVLFAAALPGLGHEKNFTYVSESETLGHAVKEVQLWTTSALGRDQYYSRLDHRAEFAVGLTPYAMAALILNWSDTTGYRGGELSSGLTWQGFTGEFKAQFTDPHQDAFGSALLLEASYGTHAFGLLGKAIFDKHIGPWRLAANVTGEMEWAPELQVEGAIERDVEWKSESADLAFHLGAAYDFGHGLAAGLEFLNVEEYAHAGEEWHLEAATFFLGPTVRYSSQSWSAALTVLPQLPALKSEGESSLDLQSHERLQTRLLLAFHF
jgi:hypothetical protein